MQTAQRIGKLAAIALGLGAIGMAVLPISASASRVVPRSSRAARLRVMAVSPEDHASGVAGATPITVTFSTALSRRGALPSIVPSIAGNWHRSGASLIFVPDGAFDPDATVTVVIPGKSGGVRGANGAMLAATSQSFSFRVSNGSVLRADQLLARLGYLPLQFVPAGGWTLPTASYEEAAFDPPAGHFAWRWTPSTLLASLWSPGVANTMFQAAVMAFEARHKLATDGDLSGQVWSALLQDGQALSANYNRAGYVYAVASKALPETLNVYDNGRDVLHSLANTGISLSPTADGNFAVYLRYQNQIMRGVDPSGQTYADPVSWVAYFNGSDAVHYFDRDSYGFPQSLGCVELPWTQAKTAWSYLQIGALVSVVG